MKPAIKLLLMFSGAVAPPPAPTNLAITGASGGVVADLTPEATWDAAAGAVTYTLQYGTASDFTGATEVTGIATNSYTHPSALTHNTTYYWRVAAVNAGGQGPWSDSVSALIYDFEATILALNPVIFFHAGNGDAIPPQMNGATDGGAVTTWNDLSTNGYHVTQGTPSARPTYHTSLSALNNRGGVTFASANNQYLSRTIAAAITGQLTTYTIVIVAYGSGQDAFNMFYAEGNSATLSYNYVSAGTADANKVRWAHTSGTVLEAGTNNADGTAQIITARRSSATAFSLRQKGVEVATSAVNSSTATDRLALGALVRSSVGQYLDGTLALVAVFNTDNYATVEPLIAAHYNI